MKKRKCAIVDGLDKVQTIFNSVSEASKAIGMRPSAIYEACRYGWKRRGVAFRFLDADGNPMLPERQNRPCIKYRKRMLSIIEKHFLPLMGQEAWDFAMRNIDPADDGMGRSLLNRVEALLAYWYTHQPLGERKFVASDAWVTTLEKCRQAMLRQQGRKSE